MMKPVTINVYDFFLVKEYMVYPWVFLYDAFSGFLLSAKIVCFCWLEKLGYRLHA